MECPLGNSMIGGRRAELPGLADDDMLCDLLEAPGGFPSAVPSAPEGSGDVVLGAPDQDDVAHVAGTQKERWLAFLAAQSALIQSALAGQSSADWRARGRDGAAGRAAVLPLAALRGLRGVH